MADGNFSPGDVPEKQQVEGDKVEDSVLGMLRHLVEVTADMMEVPWDYEDRQSRTDFVNDRSGAEGEGHSIVCPPPSSEEPPEAELSAGIANGTGIIQENVDADLTRAEAIGEECDAKKLSGAAEEVCKKSHSKSSVSADKNEARSVSSDTALFIGKQDNGLKEDASEVNKRPSGSKENIQGKIESTENLQSCESKDTEELMESLRKLINFQQAPCLNATEREVEIETPIKVAVSQDPVTSTPELEDEVNSGYEEDNCDGKGSIPEYTDGSIEDVHLEKVEPNETEDDQVVECCAQNPTVPEVRVAPVESQNIAVIEFSIPPESRTQSLESPDNLSDSVLSAEPDDDDDSISISMHNRDFRYWWERNNTSDDLGNVTFTVAIRKLNFPMERVLRVGETKQESSRKAEVRKLRYPWNEQQHPPINDTTILNDFPEVVQELESAKENSDVTPLAETITFSSPDPQTDHILPNKLEPFEVINPSDSWSSFGSSELLNPERFSAIQQSETVAEPEDVSSTPEDRVMDFTWENYGPATIFNSIPFPTSPLDPDLVEHLAQITGRPLIHALNPVNSSSSCEEIIDINFDTITSDATSAVYDIETSHIEQENLQQFISEEWDPREDDIVSTIENELIEISEVGKVENEVIDICDSDEQITARNYADKECKSEKEGLVKIAKERDYNDDDDDDDYGGGGGESEETVDDDSEVIYECNPENFRTAVIVAQNMETNILNILNGLMQTQMMAERVRNDAELSAYIDKELNARKEELNRAYMDDSGARVAEGTETPETVSTEIAEYIPQLEDTDIALDHVGDSETEKNEEEEEREVLDIKASEGDFGDRHSFDSKVDKCCTEVLSDEVIDKVVTPSKTELNALEKLLITEDLMKELHLDTTVSEYDDEHGEDIAEGIGEFSPENLQDFKQMVEEYQKLVDNVCSDIKEEMVKQSDEDKDEGISSYAEEAVLANMGEIDGQTSAVSDPCEASSQGTACQVGCLDEYQTGPIPSVSDDELKLCEEDEGEATSLQDSMEMSMLKDSVNIEENSVSVRASTSVLSSVTLEGFIIRGTQRIPSDMQMETFSLADSVQESFSGTKRFQHCEANTVGKSTSDGPSTSGVKVKSLTEKDNRNNASSGTKSFISSAEIGSTESTESYQEPVNVTSQKSDYTSSKLELVPITPNDFANAMENILEYVKPEFQIVQETSSGVKRTKCKLSDVQNREMPDISHPTDEKETRVSKPVETLANMNDSDIKVKGEDSFPSNEEDIKIEVSKTTEACQRDPNVSGGEEEKFMQSMMGSLEIDQAEKVEKAGISPVQEETTATSGTPQTYEKRLDGSLPIEKGMREKETEKMDGYLEECENTKSFAKGDEKIEGIDVFQPNDEDSKALNQLKVSDKINECQPELPIVADKPEFTSSSVVIQNNASSHKLNSEREHQSTVICLLETNNTTFFDKARLKVLSNTNQIKLQELKGESESKSVHLPGATASYDSEITEPEFRLQNEEMLSIVQMKNPKIITENPENEMKEENLGQTKIEEGAVDSERKEKEISGVIQSNEVKVLTRTELKGAPEQGTAAVETANQMEKLSKPTQPKQNDNASEEINPKQNETKGENLGQTKIEDNAVDSERKEKEISGVIQSNEVKVLTRTELKGAPEQGTAAVETANQMEKLSKPTQPKQNDNASEEINPKQSETKGENLGQTKIEDNAVDSERKEKEISGVIQSNEVKVLTRTELKGAPEQGTAAVETANQMEKLSKPTQPKQNDNASEEINPKQSETKEENLGQTKIEDNAVDSERKENEISGVIQSNKVKVPTRTELKGEPEQGTAAVETANQMENLSKATLPKQNDNASEEINPKQNETKGENLGQTKIEEPTVDSERKENEISGVIQSNDVKVLTRTEVKDPPEQGIAAVETANQMEKLRKETLPKQNDHASEEINPKQIETKGESLGQTKIEERTMDSERKEKEISGVIQSNEVKVLTRTELKGAPEQRTGAVETANQMEKLNKATKPKQNDHASEEVNPKQNEMKGEHLGQTKIEDCTLDTERKENEISGVIQSNKVKVPTRTELKGEPEQGTAAVETTNQMENLSKATLPKQNDNASEEINPKQNETKGENLGQTKIEEPTLDSERKENEISGVIQSNEVKVLTRTEVKDSPEQGTAAVETANQMEKLRKETLPKQNDHASEENNPKQNETKGENLSQTKVEDCTVDTEHLRKHPADLHSPKEKKSKQVTLNKEEEFTRLSQRGHRELLMVETLSKDDSLPETNNLKENNSNSVAHTQVDVDTNCGKSGEGRGSSQFSPPDDGPKDNDSLANDKDQEYEAEEIPCPYVDSQQQEYLTQVQDGKESSGSDDAER